MTKKILIIAAHPDDEVLGCFGTIAKYIQKGYEIETLILSKGKTSRENISQKELKLYSEEMYKANNYIGITQIHQFDFPDNAFDSVPLLNIVKKIEEIKNIFKPKIIFTHHYGDINIDHQITYKAVLTATRPMKDEPVKTIYSFEVPSSTEWNSYSKETAFIPNTFIDISDTIDDKINAMKQYQSELRDFPHPRSLQHIKELAKINGTKVGLNFCENFILVRQLG